MSKKAHYVALLRGINVGGNKAVKMSDLKIVFESMGFTDVKTLLITGNVIFNAPIIDPQTLAAKIETQLENSFGFTIPVIVRESAHIRSLIAAEPFKKIKVTSETRLYITFLSDPPKSSLKIPYISPARDFEILDVSETEVCSVLTLSAKMRTTESMKILEKEFGKRVTTRNWNTVIKVGMLLATD